MEGLVETLESSGRLHSLSCAGAVYSTSENTDNQIISALEMQDRVIAFALTK